MESADIPAPDWARLARDTRTSIDLLGDDPPPCYLGGDGAGCHPDSSHAAANLGALRALVQDIILRLSPGEAEAVWLGHQYADSALHGWQHTHQRPPGAPPAAGTGEWRAGPLPGRGTPAPQADQPGDANERTRTMPMPIPGQDFDPDADKPDDSHPLLAAAAAPAQWGLDYAWQHLGAAQLAALLHANGAQFAARYLADAVPGGKGMMPAEAAALRHAGITICPCWEVTGTDFTRGYDAGLADGRAAQAALRGHEAPAGTLVWFAIDTGTTNYAATNGYLRGCKAGTGPYIAQLYGSYGVVEAAAAAGLGSSHWQTYAWSGKRVSGHALLYQYQNGVLIGGISMDRDRTLQPMAGPWAHTGHQAAPPPVPAGQAPAFPYPAGHYLGTASPDPACHSGANAADQPNVLRWQAQMAGRGWTITADGQFGAQSETVARAFQAEKQLPADGKVGPATWAASWTAPVT